MFWTPQLQAALMRAGVGSILAFLTTAGVADALTNGQWKIALGLGGTAVVTYMVWRGGLEGVYDANRASAGNVKPGDIQALPTLVQHVPLGPPVASTPPTGQPPPPSI